MNSSAGHGHGQGQRPRGHERKFNIGRSFIKRLAIRIRGGNANSATTASSNASIREEPSNHLVLDVGEDNARADEADTLPSAARGRSIDVVEPIDVG